MWQLRCILNDLLQRIKREWITESHFQKQIWIWCAHEDIKDLFLQLKS